MDNLYAELAAQAEAERAIEDEGVYMCGHCGCETRYESNESGCDECDKPLMLINDIRARALRASLPSIGDCPYCAGRYTDGSKVACPHNHAVVA